VEELYVHGLQLEQYKQHNYDPKDYYLAGLIKDPQDIRCNTAMARLAYKAGEFTKCVEYCSVAMERLLSRNEHPEYLEPIYLKALALVRLHDDESAARLFDKVLWSYTLRSQAFFELACIDARRGAFTSALTNLKACLETNPNHSRAANLLAAITRKSAGPLPDDVLQIHISSDPLDIMARLEYWFANKSDSRASELMQIFGKNPQWYLDAIGEYMYAGLYDDALSVLDFIDSASPIVPFYRAFLSSKIALKCSDDGLPLGDGVYFPNRADDFSILTWAVDHRFHADEAAYLAGCYLYDKERYDEAISYWESAIALNPRHAYAFRTLAIGYFDKKHDKRSARLCMEKAFKLTSDSRIFYELQQLLKQSNVSSEYRLSLYEQDRFLTEKRDDCYLDWITLLCSLGKYEDAMHLIGNRTFHIYEGGEGKLTKQHGWLYVLSGLSHLGRGEYEPAIELFRQASIIPPSYGEAKSWFAQEGHIYYFIGEALRLSGEDKAKSHEAYRTASEPKSAISEISLFRALALQRLEAFSEARNVLEEMIEQGDALLANADRYPYFGVGSVTPTPFNYDIRKTNEIEGGILKAFALLGLGRIQEADKVLASVKALDPYEFRLHVFDTIAPFV
jgi:tetratricopeptide (TPR) repeat protein